ncbi:hypothetical protein GCM10010112_89080 [Actinoplanes lobatus]|uniref:Uncharacterized protein n=1 Tax=Actinoplanes lobatus TaxID=113568 RepID=A0A7W7HNX4_9ACTN|nr:hypothetical protein [Actinoplanes lobatus]MBB4753899.1 hypothetical protein [Actinoplanes lobatus]GGN97152.1 hypothetical protein GCM10010112_89080 [Actinoplanes lobatus]GIE45514.1 hypothetical protein Alo02nite_84120 [Actinoplanes lobatus]
MLLPNLPPSAPPAPPTVAPARSAIAVRPGGSTSETTAAPPVAVAVRVRPAPVAQLSDVLADRPGRPESSTAGVAVSHSSEASFKKFTGGRIGRPRPSVERRPFGPTISEPAAALRGPRPAGLQEAR